MRYLEGIGQDLLIAMTLVRLQGARFSAGDNYLVFRFAPHLVESVIAITASAREGLQSAARRELRFLLEAAVKLSSRDFHPKAKSFEERLAGLNDRDRRFEDYVASLTYFAEFDKPEEANAAVLSLYSELSRAVHATATQFEEALSRSQRGEDAGMESVATLSKFNKLTMQVYDIVLVRMFHGLGLSLSGDIFTSILDNEPRWRFHKAKHVARLSKCFDYKHERRARPGEI